MTIAHEIFDIFGFIVALLGLYRMWVEAEVSRKFIVAAVTLLLLGLGGVVGYEYFAHRKWLSA